jgi:trehalose 6-phosphate synthase
VNERDAALLLSREAGAFDVLGDVADALHPFDEVATARAIGQALDRPEAHPPTGSPTSSPGREATP